MSYELGQNIAKNLKQLKKDPSDAEPWARYSVVTFVLSVAFFFAYIGYEHDVMTGYILAIIITAFAYDFAEKEIDYAMSIFGTILKWIIYAILAIGCIYFISNANPIVAAILLGAWFIASAINNKK